MAKKRTRDSLGRFKKTARRKARKNPARRGGGGGRARRYARRAGAYARGTLAGINILGAFKSTLPLLLGALAAKFAAKRFADGGAEGDNWTWKNYGLGLLGGFIAAVAASAIFRTRWQAAQKVMEGAFLLIAYKIFVYEIAPMNSTLESWFAGAEEDMPDEEPIAGYLGEYGEEDDYEGYGEDDEEGTAGDIYPAADVGYVRGEDGHWRPINEAHRLPQFTGYGDTVAPVNPAMGGFGEVVSPVNPTMGGYGQSEVLTKFQKAYERAA